MRYIISFVCITAILSLNFFSVHAAASPTSKTVSGEITPKSDGYNKKPSTNRNKLKLEQARLKKQVETLTAEIRILGLQIDAAKVKVSAAITLGSNYRKILERQLAQLQEKKKASETKQSEIMNKIRYIETLL